MVEVAEARSGQAGRLGSAAPAATATWIYPIGSGDSYWRCQAPARAVGGKLCAVPEKKAGRAFTNPNSDTPFPWHIDATLADGEHVLVTTKQEWKDLCKSRARLLSVQPRFPSVEGVAVFARPDPARGSLMLTMQEQGIRTLAETDDNYFAANNQNLFLRLNNHSDSERLMHARGMAMADAMVFSTEALRDIYWKQMKERLGKQHIPESFVCRNSVARSDWPDRDEGDGTLRVGFMGSPSHVWDVNLAYAAFHAAQTEGCETVMIGYNPANPDPDIPDIVDTDDGPVAWRSEKSAEFKSKWGKVVTRAIPWIAPDEYHRAALPLDIGLCPLRTDGFTLAKSDVKALEYSISGAAVVCQNNAVYNTAGWRHEVNCLMAGSPYEFAQQTLRLIRDPRLRFELVSAAQDMIASERNELTMRLEWGAALAG